MSCKDCGHMKRCHGGYAHMGNKGCRLGSSICLKYVRKRKWHRHYMQEFYDLLSQGDWWRKKVKGRLTPK